MEVEMDLLLAIMWFLNLLIPGKTYTKADIDAMALQNQSAIQAVQKDAAQTNQAVSTYDKTKNIIEPWDDDLPDPIPD